MKSYWRWQSSTRVYIAASRTYTSGISSASKILFMMKSRSAITKKFWLAYAIDLKRAFEAIVAAGKPLPSSLLIVDVRATIIAFLRG